MFTSGATESNNLAIKGLAAPLGRAAAHIVVTVATEHKAVLDPMPRAGAAGLARHGAAGRRDGLIDLDALREAITERTALVSVMAANNEIGVLQPLPDDRRRSRTRRARGSTPTRCRRRQVPFDVEGARGRLRVADGAQDLGPKGVGALYVRRNRGVAIAPQIDGGGHERGMRSGTLNVPGIVGFGRAAEIARAEMAGEAKRVGELRDRLLDGAVEAGIDGIGERAAERAVAGQPERELHRYRRRSAAGEPARTSRCRRARRARRRNRRTC